MKTKKWMVSACLLLMQAGAWGKITLPDIVSDNMVLQQCRSDHPPVVEPGSI